MERFNGMLLRKILNSIAVALSIASLSGVAQAALYPSSVLPFEKGVQVLSSATPDQTVQFDIVLKIRNLTGLKNHIAGVGTIRYTDTLSDYLPLQQDYQAVIQWAQSSGLSVVNTYSSNLTVKVSGTVAKVQQVLGVKLFRVQVDGKVYIATNQPPNLPDYMRQYVLGINGLQPYQRAYPLSIAKPASAKVPYTPPYSVQDIKTAYNANGIPTTGSGQRIAILIDTFANDSDLTSFWAANGVPQSLSNIEKVQVVAGTLHPPDPMKAEESLDEEWASGIAPQAKVRVYATKDLSFVNLDQGFQGIISDLNSGLPIQQLSISLGACENQVTDTQKNTDDQYLAIIAARGVSIFFASGDDGSNCPGGSGVEFYASSPNGTAVGGTTTQLFSGGTVSSETAWGGSGGGISTFFPKPSWQVGRGVPNTNFRSVPDIALNADPNTGYYVVVNGQVYQYGGTSAGAPTWAGFLALINQGRAAAGKPSLGLLGPIVYPLLNTANFRDITFGSNGGYGAGPGYDLVTGIGVPVVGTLYNTLVFSSNPPPPIPPPPPSQTPADYLVPILQLLLLN